MQRGGAWGYIDRTGKIVITPSFARANFFYEGLAATELDGHWGFINETGTIIIPHRFTAVTDFSSGLAAVSLQGKEPGQDIYGYIDSTGVIVTSCSFQCTRPYFEGMMADAVKTVHCPGVDTMPRQLGCAAQHPGDPPPVLNDSWGYYDTTGKLAFPSVFRAGLSRFSGGVAAVQPQGSDKMGYIDAHGVTRIPPQFDRAEAFFEERAAVKLGDKWGFVDRDGHFIVKPQFEAVGSFSDGYALFVSDGKSGYIDANGKIMLPPQYSEASPFNEGLAAVCCEKGNSGYIDKSGVFRILLNQAERRLGGPFSDGVALVSVSGGQVYIDQVGKQIAPLSDGSKLRP